MPKLGFSLFSKSTERMSIFVPKTAAKLKLDLVCMFTYSSKGSEKNVGTLYMKEEVGGNQLLEIQKQFQSL